MKYLALHILTSKYGIKEQYTDWQENFGTQEVFVCDKCSSGDKTAEIAAVPILINASATTVAHDCKKSVFLLISSIYACGVMCCTEVQC
jgi:hypothetical protein